MAGLLEKTKEPAIRIEDLWKVYAKNDQDIDVENEDLITELDKSEESVVAVRDLSLTVDPGNVFVVMGLSGSGKSTLIRCIIRLINPTAGKISIFGEEITSMDNKTLTQFRRNQVAMVFQHYGLLPHRTVLQNVQFGLKIKGIGMKDSMEKAEVALDRVGLKGWENYYPSSLSGGMRQRVGIARAIVMDSPILLMDEPFSGLDPLIRREMQDELIRLQEEMHKTIFFITHDLDEAMRLGDKMAVMKNGSIVQQGSPEDILANPADEYVARFVQDIRKRVELADKHEKMEASGSGTNASSNSEQKGKITNVS